MYGVCRIPQVGCDTISAPPPSSAPDAHQIIILVYDWLYAVEVYDKAWNLIAPQELENRLRRVAADVTYRQKCGERAIPVGVLSADDRDSWAENLQYLLSLSPVNVRTFEAVQHSIFALSLDDWTYGATPESRSTPSIPRVNSAIEINNHLQNVRSSLDARNRWFDKALTVIVETNTRAGAMGEHSPLDALVPSIAAEYSIVTDIDRSAFANPNPEDTSFDRESKVGWARLDWMTDALIERKCDRAKKRAEEVIVDSDDAVMWFNEYGGDWIKDAARLPPDAYVQMALQLAWYRTRGFFTATYETALTRLFEHGRTETIRTLTSDSRAWVLAMVDPSTPLQKRLALLRRAVQTHTRLTREAAVGKGIDRHLLGLLCMLRPSEGEFSALFEDELFTRSQMWKLSTSGLSAGPLFRGTGFGSPYHDGYGINYLTGPDMIKFGVESKHGCPLTSTAIFLAAIKDALRDMRVIFTQDLSHSDNPEMARL
ncbi:hypothetical protein EWM64_g789 [Hericium alpestre]|uniref:Choline/carnitine acyltransferase domain-containing protein n=1 Tax=Hericium alpestre TaxID=135208 RepID=A0A4Z0AB51_9AGAM|nr:hypothetical protein EWM64_g789 [Hericium alpestre]